MTTQVKPLHIIMKQVTEAQNLDALGSIRDAYIKYLQSIQYVTQQLLIQAQNDSGLMCDVSSQKMINVVTMCVQRSEDIIKNQIENQSRTDPQKVLPKLIMPNSSTTLVPKSLSDVETGSTSLPLAPSTKRPDVSMTGAESWPGVQPSRMLTDVDVGRLMSSPHEPSPLEIAERQNKQLMSAYRARIAGLNKGSHIKSTDLNLGLQRRLAENLALAKSREQALTKKRAERRRRLEEQAAKRFTATEGMSQDELERRQMYTRILEYEQDNKWLLQLRKKLKDNPEDCELIQQLVSHILRTLTHPLTQLLYGYQHKLYNQMHPLLVQWNQARRKSYLKQNTGSVSDQTCMESPDRDVPGLNTLQSPETNGQDLKVHVTTNQQFSPSAYDISNFDDLFEYGSSHEEPTQAKCDSHHQVSIRKQSSLYDLEGLCFNPTGVSETVNPEATGSVSADISDPNNIHPADSNTHTTENTPISSHASCDQYSANQANNKDISSQQSPDGTQGNLTPSSLPLLELEREAIQRHLGNITREVQDLLEKLVTMFIVAYENLDNPTGRDSCYSSLEEPFYKSIWGHILALFRAVNYKDEESVTAAMTRLSSCTPETLKVDKKFWLLPEESLLMPEGYLPYQLAIDELSSLAKMVSPLTKLENIVQVSRTICKCVEDFYNNNKAEVPNIGADDLLPILSFVVLKTNLPQMMSECQALEELVHEGYLMGEEGYCLTSLETATRYVATLSQGLVID